MNFGSCGNHFDPNDQKPCNRSMWRWFCMKCRIDCCEECSAFIAKDKSAVANAHTAERPVKTELVKAEEEIFYLTRKNTASATKAKAAEDDKSDNTDPATNLILWKVVAGDVTNNGIVARKGHELGSEMLPESLAVGALLQELTFYEKEQRLFFYKLTGTGPRQGWVTVTIPGKTLVERTTTDHLLKKSDVLAASAAAASDAKAAAIAKAAQAELEEFEGAITVAIYVPEGGGDQISEAMHAELQDLDTFEVDRISSAKKLTAKLTSGTYHWLHTITKLKLPSEGCPDLSMVAVMPHLYTLEDKASLQTFMNNHQFQSCIPGFSFDILSTPCEDVIDNLDDLHFPYIIKPACEGERRGIGLLREADDLYRAISAYDSQIWVVQRLESPAFLLNERKFHIRLFALVSRKQKTTTIYMGRAGPIYFSKVPHAEASKDSEAELSGGTGTGYSETWPEFLEESPTINVARHGRTPSKDIIELLLPQARQICKDFLGAISARDFNVSGTAYRLIAFDVMLCAHPKQLFQAKVMEVNIAPYSVYQSPHLARAFARGLLHHLWPQQYSLEQSDDIFEKVGTHFTMARH